MIHKLTLLVLFFLASIIYSCTKEEGWGAGDSYLHVTDINLTNNRFEGLDLEERKMLKKNDSAHWDRYIIHLFFESVGLVSQSSNLPGNLYALSPEVPCLDPVGVDTLLIISQKKYNNTYNVGDTINDIVTIHQGIAESNSELAPISIEDYITHNQYELFACAGIDILLNEPPSDSMSVQSFKIIFKMKDNRVFMSKSQEIHLLY